MSTHSDLFEKTKWLPEDKQRVVKSLVDQLLPSAGEFVEESQVGWYGSREGLEIAIGEEEISKARHEMWREFPREVDH